jgi:hypothetical protein
MIYANVLALADEAHKKAKEFRAIEQHLRGIVEADKVAGIDLTSQQKQDALDELVALETAANNNTDYLAVRNATEPV